MDSGVTSFRSVISLWRSPGRLADDIGAPRAAVRKWDQRGRIPDEWWSAILATETAKFAGLTAELFVDLAARSVVRESAEDLP